MFVMSQNQGFGESANELVAKWGNRGYRYGFPGFIAYEPPVRPMNYDQSRMYSGVFGKRYLNAETARYNYLYDPNLYLQPGISGASQSLGEVSKGTSRAIVIGGALTLLAVGVIGFFAIKSAGRERDDWDSYSIDD